MKTSLLSLWIGLLFVAPALAGIMEVVQEGGSVVVNGGEVKYFKLENDGEKAQLYLLNDKDQGCRIPVSQLKDLSIDPVQFGLNMKNVRGLDGLSLTCYMTREQFVSRFLTTRIQVSSWHK